MYQDDPDLEQRLSRFEAQLDRFSLALHQWQQNQETVQPASTQTVDQRIRTLEETLDREAHVLRQMHEEPLKQLQAQAASLKEVCEAATNSVTGLDQAESRLVALQNNVHLQLSDLSRTIQALVAELRVGASTSIGPQSATAAWPLDRVVHLHDELRRAANGRDAGPSTAGQTFGNVSSEARVGRGRLIEHAVPAERGESLPTIAVVRRSWYIAAAAAVAAGLLIFGLVRRIETRLDDASSRVAAAERQAEATTERANQEMTNARQEANRQIAEARESAQRAETVSAILAAPDLVRINLTGGAVERSFAQLLLSRTRGLVLSASRLPPAPPQMTYQLWLLTTAAPVSAGLFVPDANGRATVVVDVPPRVAGPVVGAQVTVEPSAGSQAPSNRLLLSRAPAAPSP
jgi:Anti-sigma-K factor rskA, C-terminal